MLHSKFRFAHTKVKIKFWGQRPGLVKENAEANLNKLHRKVKEDEKMYRHVLEFHAEVQVHNRSSRSVLSAGSLKALEEYFIEFHIKIKDSGNVFHTQG